jgi:hypothetical protein
MSEEQPAQSVPAEPAKSAGVSGFLKFAIGLLVAMIVVVFVGSIVAVIAALADPGAAEKIGAIRDVVIIVLTWLSVLIGVSLIILILQIAALFNLLKNEVMPLLESVQKTADTVRGTTTFVSQNLTRPIIRATGLFAYLRAILEALDILRRAQPRRPTEESQS